MSPKRSSTLRLSTVALVRSLFIVRQWFGSSFADLAVDRCAASYLRQRPFRPQLSSSTPSRLKPVQGRDPHSSVSALHMSQWPKDQQQRHADNDDKHFKWQAEFPVVTKTEAARPQDQGIVLVANWRQERAGGSDCDSHEKAVGIDAQC